MRSTEEYKKYVGSTSLYDIINNRRPPLSSQRQPVFLQRNIRQIIDGHERALNSIQSQPTNAASEPTETGMKQRNARSRLLPSKDMLAKSMRERSRLLRIHPRKLIKQEPNSNVVIEALPSSAVKEETSVDPSWLPAPDSVQIRCNVTCRISVEEPGNESRTLYTESRLANLVGTKDARGDLSFLIDLKHPFMVTANHLLATNLTSCNANGSTRWKRTTLSHATLSVGISCLNSDDAHDLLCAIDPAVTPQHDLLPEHAELRATWKKLPDCPDRLPSLRRYYNEPGSECRRSSKRLNYCLDASIVWNTGVSSTPLALCNHAIQVARKRKIPPERLPKEPPKQPQNCHITYIFSGGGKPIRTTVETTYKCIFCPERAPQKSFDRLHFHYLSCHDHFEITVFEPSNANPSLITRILSLDLATPKYERASDSVSDDRELCWARPARPFDLQRYLLEGGENSWASGKAVDPTKVMGILVTDFVLDEETGQLSVGDGVARPKGAPLNGQIKKIHLEYDPIPVPRQIIPPEQVQDLRTRTRKTFQVPNIGVDIYRSHSKRKVQPGEMLSESDEEPDGSWLVRKHMLANFQEFSGAAREFIQLFDGHFLRERISADTYVGEAIVRFTRAHAEQLSQPRLLPQFQLKLSQLKQRDLISDEYLAYCQKLVPGSAQTNDIKNDENSEATEFSVIKVKHEVKESSTPRASYLPPPKFLKDPSEEDVIMIDDSDTEAGVEVSPAILTPSLDTSSSVRSLINGVNVVKGKFRVEALTGDVCPKCSKPTMEVRGVIVCANPKCPHTGFHMSCMGLASREHGWRCDDCRESVLPESLA